MFSMREISGANLFKYVHFPNISAHENNFIFQKLYLQTSKVAYVIDNLYCYKTRTGSLMVTKKSTVDCNITDLERQFFDLALAKRMYFTILNNYKNLLEKMKLTKIDIYLKFR